MGRDWVGWLIGKDKGRKRWRKRNGYGAGRSFLGLLHSLKLVGWRLVGWVGFCFLGRTIPVVLMAKTQGHVLYISLCDWEGQEWGDNNFLVYPSPVD